MKKIFFSLLAIAALASCAKTEAVYTEADSEIKLAPVAAKQTKANVLGAIDGTEYPTAENFDVYGYWKNVGAGETYIDGQSYFGGAVEFTNKGNYWGGVTPYYWPKNGALRFAAYSPSSLDIAHSQDGDTFSGAYTQPSKTNETWDFLVAPTSESYTAMTAAENVSIVFEHALSWITLQVKAKDEAAEDVFTIKSITINDVNTTAAFKASMLGQEMVQYESWSNWGTPAKYVVFDGEQAVNGEAEVIETVTAGTLVIPQETTNVTVVFDQKGVNGTMDMTDMEVTLDLNLDLDEEPWRPGYHYTYTLIFGLDEILINPSVDTWEEYVWTEGGSNGNIDTDKEIANVATEEQLVAALANGGKVVLQNNITISETLNVTNTVVLELNGFTLTNQVANETTDVIVVAEGGELTINGDGTIEAVTGNDGYAVISEGLLIINGGEFKAGEDENGEANAVIYARGNGKVFVNGGTFHNEYDSNFVLNKKDADRATTEISVAGGKFEKFNPGDNAAEGAGTNFLKAGFMAVANGDWFQVVKGEGASAVLVNTIDEIQAALDAATEDVQVVFGADMVGDITVDQKEGVNVVVDGNGYKFDGTLYINGHNRLDGAETLTVKNVNFATEATAKDFIWNADSKSGTVRYAHNITIDGCTFTAPEGSDVVAMRCNQAYDIVVKNCTMNGGHSLAQNTACSYQKYDNCTVTAGRGLNILTSGDVDVINCNFKATKADGYGVRVDATYANVLNVRGCAIEAYEPIVLRSAKAVYTLNLSNTTLILANGGTEEIVVKGETPVINR